MCREKLSTKVREGEEGERWRGRRQVITVRSRQWRAGLLKERDVTSDLSHFGVEFRASDREPQLPNASEPADLRDGLL